MEKFFRVGSLRSCSALKRNRGQVDKDDKTTLNVGHGSVVIMSSFARGASGTSKDDPRHIAVTASGESITLVADLNLSRVDVRSGLLERFLMNRIRARIISRGQAVQAPPPFLTEDLVNKLVEKGRDEGLAAHCPELRDESSQGILFSKK